MRIVGINIPDNKRIEVALTYIYGIGHTAARDIVSHAKANPDTRAKDLTSEEVNRIQEYLEKRYKVEGELRQVIKEKIGLLKELQTYRGMRHMRHLPVRGQRTHTNARTRKGPAKPIAGKKKVTK